MNGWWVLYRFLSSEVTTKTYSVVRLIKSLLRTMLLGGVEWSVCV